MDEPIIEGNCGELCNYHCCRSHEGDEALGMYLLPLEYQAFQEKLKVKYEVHSSYDYDIVGAKKLFYIYCDNNSGCLRTHRPIQCRTYPLEPHLENDKLKLVIAETQIHDCPLINQTDLWRKEFIDGVYEGWKLLLTLEPIRKYVEALSKQREHIHSVVKGDDAI